MKTFVAAIMILCILMVCSVINCLYIDRVTAQMMELEASFPDKAEDGEAEQSKAISEASELWERSKNRLLCSAKNSYVTAVTTALHNTAEFYEHGTRADYLASRSLLEEALISLSDSDSLSLWGII